MVVPIRDQMQSDLTAAMKARDRTRVKVLRSTLAAVANAEAVDLGPHVRANIAGRTVGPTEVERRHLTEAHIRELVAGHQAQLEAASALMAAVDETAEARDLAEQAAILLSYL